MGLNDLKNEAAGDGGIKGSCPPFPIVSSLLQMLSSDVEATAPNVPESSGRVVTGCIQEIQGGLDIPWRYGAMTLGGRSSQLRAHALAMRHFGSPAPGRRLNR